MAYDYQNGSGIDSDAYIYVQLQVTHTDYDTYTRFNLASVAVSDTGSSGFIKGQVTTNQAGTSWTASTGWKDVYYNGTTTLATSSFDVTRGSTDITVRCGAYAEGGGTGRYAGGTDYAWLNITVPRVESPNAPSALTATYVSDSRATLSWTNGSTSTAKPRTATLIERRSDSANWVQIASVSASATSYTDNGLEPNHQYQYRVRAQNSVYFSDYTESGSVYTTPAAPTEIPLSKTAAATVQLNATGSWPYQVVFDIESTYDNGATWASEATNVFVPYNVTVNPGTVQFRVKAVRGELSSGWTLSASLVTITPPLAPTIVSAPSGSIANGSTATIAWTPNHPDGSAQEAAQVKVTYPNSSSTTFGITTATSWTSAELSDNGTYTVQVRTKGLDPSWGEWSQSVSFGVYNLPNVAIDVPLNDSETVASLPYRIEWSVIDPTGVSAQRLIITDSDENEILNRQLAADVRIFELTQSNISLNNGGRYRITLRVMGGSGLIATQLRTFNVSWTPPSSPTATITDTGDGSLSLQVTYGGGSPATVSVDVARVNPDGTTWQLASRMADGDEVVDPLPPLGVPVEYRIVASAESGATRSVIVTGMVETTDWVLNFGPGAQESMSLWRNPSASYTLDQGGDSYHFADGGAGNGLPVWYGTTDRDISGSLKFDTVTTADTDRLSWLCMRYPVAWLRDPVGHRWRARIRPNVNHGVGPVWQASISWEAVRWTEAWDG